MIVIIHIDIDKLGTRREHDSAFIMIILTGIEKDSGDLKSQMIA